MANMQDINFVATDGKQYPVFVLAPPMEDLANLPIKRLPLQRKWSAFWKDTQRKDFFQ